MRQEWSSDELVSARTLVDEDWPLVGNKTGATRLGFALVLKFFEIDARFPQHAGEVPVAAVAYVAEQVKVPAEEFAGYSWSSRSIEYHRAQIRGAFGFREFTRGDEDKLAGWLAEEVSPVELGDEALREAVLVRCRAEHIEPPGRIARIVGTARSAFEARFCQRTVSRLDEATTARLLGLVESDDDTGHGGRGLLGELKADPGPVGAGHPAARGRQARRRHHSGSAGRALDAEQCLKPVDEQDQREGSYPPDHPEGPQARPVWQHRSGRYDPCLRYLLSPLGTTTAPVASSWASPAR